LHWLHPTLFIINFSLAQLFCNPTTYLHVPFTASHSIIGTLPFASVNGQQGNSQSRCDNLESLAYTIIYLVLSDLPWTRNPAGNDLEAVLRKKTSIMVEELCEGLPAPFCKFVTHVCSLHFEEKPDYQYLYSILLQCLEAMTDQPDDHVEAIPLCTHPNVIVDHKPVFTGQV
jgi:hypothetical protein